MVNVHLQILLVRNLGIVLYHSLLTTQKLNLILIFLFVYNFQFEKSNSNLFYFTNDIW